MLPLPRRLLLSREDRPVHPVSVPPWILLSWWYRQYVTNSCSSWTCRSGSHVNLVRRYSACNAVSLSSRILQPGAHDSDTGQLPSLSSRTLLWERETDKSVWKVQGWSVCLPFFFLCLLLFFFFLPKIQSQQYGRVYQCHDFIMAAVLFVSSSKQIIRKHPGSL